MLLLLVLMLLLSTAPTAPQSVVLTFKPQLSFSFNNGMLNTTANISWLPPLELNGVITGYTLTLVEGTAGPETLLGTAGGGDTSALFMVSVSPYVQYTVSVVASTSAGSSNAAVSASVFSPEAGELIVSSQGEGGRLVNINRFY